jgi:hypothetical protein
LWTGTGGIAPCTNHIAERLQHALRNLPGVVVTSVPFQLAD